MENRKRKDSATRHPGLAILEALMCFELIVSYIWEVNVPSTGIGGWINYLKDYSFPVFMVLAFFIAGKALENVDGRSIGERVMGIIIPLWGWAVIYWIFYMLLKETLSPGYNLGIKDLLLQMVTGNSPYLNNVMWYQVDLLILTFVFLLIIMLANKFHSPILALFMMVAVFVQYSGLTLFIGNWKSEFAGTIGRLPEMIPLAVAGYLLAYFGTLDKTRKYWPITIVVSLLVTVFLRYFTVFTDVKGFGFAGLRKLCVAVALVTLFYAAPLEKLPRAVKTVIEWITNYTLGIFCMHRLISNLLHYMISHRGWITMETYTMVDCIVTYVICYLIAFLISRIPLKWTKMLVE